MENQKDINETIESEKEVIDSSNNQELEPNTNQDINLHNNVIETTITEEKNLENQKPEFINEVCNTKLSIKSYILVAIVAILFSILGTFIAVKIFVPTTKIIPQNTANHDVDLNIQPNSIQQVAEKNLKGVVDIELFAESEFLKTDQAIGSGSGVIISKDGYIVTNHHVIDGEPTKIKVTLNNQEVYDATIVGSDEKSDIAVIKIEGSNFTPVTIGSSSNLKVGDLAIAIGNPLGILGGTVTDGIISSINRNVVIDGESMNLIQTNAQVNPGNSGGGLFDANGNLIGIVVAKKIDQEVEGIGFAIPIDDSIEIINDIIEFGYYTNRPTIGVLLLEIPSGYTQDPGLYITEAVKGSPAEKAGIETDDKIVSVNDEYVYTYLELSKIINQFNVGDTITINVLRDNEELSFDVVLGKSNKE